MGAIAVVSLLILISLFVFPGFYIKQIALLKLGSYCKHHFQTPFSYKSCTWDGTYLLFEGINMGKEGFRCEVEKGSFKPSLFWKKKILGGRVNLEGVHLILSKKEEKNLFGKALLDNLAKGRLPFFKVNFEAQVTNGSILLDDSQNKAIPPHKMEWELSYFLSHKNSFGKFKIDLAPGSPILDIAFTQKKGGALHLVGSIQKHAASPFIGALRLLFSPFSSHPQLDWICEQGEIEGHMDAKFLNGGIAEIAGTFSMYNVCATNPTLNLHVGLESFSASYQFDFTTLKNVDNWNTRFLVNRGLIQSDAPGSKTWELKDIFSEIHLRKGFVESSSFSALLKSGYFQEGQFEVAAHLHSSISEPAIHGEIKEGAHHLDFSCFFNKKGPFFDLEKIAFRGRELPLEKMLNPFLLDNVNMNISAVADVEGELEGDLVTMKYLPKEIVVDSPHFTAHCQRPGLGYHTFNIKSKEHEGSLPLASLSYLHKKCGLFFPQAKATAVFAGDTISLKDIKTDWEGINLAGKVDIGIHSLADIDLTLLVNAAYGPASSCQKFFSHFSDSLFWKLPIVGDIATIGKEIVFDFHFDPECSLRKGLISGKCAGDVDLREVIGPFVPIKISRFVSDFCFDAIEKKIQFFGAEGNLLDRDGQKPIYVRASNFEVSDLPRGEICCDLSFGERECELARLSFSTQTLNEKKLFTIDKEKTFLAGSSLNIDCLEMHGWKEFIALEAALDLPLDAILKTADWMGIKCPLLCTEFSDLTSNVTGGRLSSLVSYKNKELTFQIQTEEIQLKNISLGRFNIDGNYEGGHLCCDEISCRLFEMIADFYFDNTGVEIPFAVIKFLDPVSACISLEGEYDKTRDLVDCRLLDFNFDLQEIPRIFFFGENLKEWLSSIDLKGNLGGSGHIHCKKMENMPLFFEAETVASFEGLKIGGVELGQGENFTCTLSSEQGLHIVGLKMEANNQSESDLPILFKLGGFRFDPVSLKCNFEGFDFSCPPQRLAGLKSLFHTLIPKASASLSSLEKNNRSFESIKKEEPLEGRISFEIAPENYWIDLSLKDGIYHLGETPFFLQNFACKVDKNGFLCKAQPTFCNKPLCLTLSTESMQFDRGMINVQEVGQPILEGEGAHVFWYRTDKGFEIEKIEGKIAGAGLSFYREKNSDDEHICSFNGKAEIDSFKDLSFLPPSLKNFFAKARLGKGYYLSGRLSVDRRNLSNCSFSGSITGKDFEIGGVTLSSFESGLSITPSMLNFKKLELKDRGGLLLIDEIALVKGESGWSFNIPYTRLSRFRPGRLRNELAKVRKKTKKNFQSLLVHNFELAHFNGTLGALETFRGEGTFSFSNYPKKGLLSNILLIPADIIACIGLDFALLVPVRGQVWYKIDEEKIVLTRSEEVYSDKKRSRFFLSKQVPSYVDFEGNLNINLKMKQYNLLMKFVELLTMNVSGKVSNPSYHLVTHKAKKDTQERLR